MHAKYVLKTPKILLRDKKNTHLQFLMKEHLHFKSFI